MKNFIKIITLFRMIVFVSPLYSMEQERMPFYSLSKFPLETLDPFLEMSSIPILKTSYTEDNRFSSMNEFPILLTHTHFIPPHYSLHTDRGFSLKLAIIKFFMTLDRIKNKDTLKTISHALNEGTSETSMHNIELCNKERIKIFPSRIPISVYQLIENLSEQKQLVDEDKNNDLIVAILKGKFNRKKKLSRELTIYTRDKLQTEMPQDIIDLILLYLPGCNVDEKAALIKTHLRRARKEFRDEQKQIEIESEKIKKQIQILGQPPVIKKFTKCKGNIISMGPDDLMNLRPLQSIDQHSRPPHHGLIAEEVVMETQPELIVHDAKGDIYFVKGRNKDFS